MPLSDSDREWYFDKIILIDPKGGTVKINKTDNFFSYTPQLKSDESNQKEITPEEMVHALTISVLLTPNFRYNIDRLYHEKHYKHGRKGTLGDEVDLIIFDDDDLPFAMWEMKSSELYDSEENSSIELQLFGTAPLVGAPKLLVYSTIKPGSKNAIFTLKCIDYSKYKTHDAWIKAGKPHSTVFPADYQDLDYKPFVNGGEVDLRLDCTTI